MMRAIAKQIHSIVRLSGALALARFKTQNEGSYLGILWYLLDPLLLFGVILVVRGAAFPAKPIELFPVYLLIGLLMLHLFTKTTTATINAASKHKAYIQNMTMPREALVVAEIFQRLLMHPFEIMVLVIVMLIVGGTFGGLLVYPLILLSYTVLLIGAGLILAPLGAYVRDFANLWSPFTRVLLFTTPIFYHASPDMLTYTINLFNPVFWYAHATRAALLPGITADPRILISMTIVPIMVLGAGIVIFRRTQHRLPELIT